MRYTLITLLTIATFSGSGQSKTKTLSVPFTSTVSISHYYLWKGTILTVEAKPTWNNPDSLIIYVRKSQLRWINDSTAVIKKP